MLDQSRRRCWRFARVLWPVVSCIRPIVVVVVYMGQEEPTTGIIVSYVTSLSSIDIVLYLFYSFRSDIPKSIHTIQPGIRLDSVFVGQFRWNSVIPCRLPCCVSPGRLGG